MNQHQQHLERKEKAQKLADDIKRMRNAIEKGKARENAIHREISERMSQAS